MPHTSSKDSNNQGQVPRLVLTTAEAAQVLGVAEYTLRDWRHMGCGPRYTKLGNGGRSSGVRYRLAALERWLCENERSSTAEER